MHKKLAFDCEEDREFWTQEFFQELAEDNNYEEETDTSSEEVDTDFDDDEQHTEDDQAAEQAVRKEELLERRKDRKKTKYVDPALKRKQPLQRQGIARGKKVLAADSTDEPTTRRSSRPQTAAKTTALKRRMELEETWKEHQPQRSRRTRKRKGMTQEQRLEEAKRTAEENTASLAKLLHREEEEKKKRRAAIRRRVITVVGPAIRIDDRLQDGEHVKTVSFRDHWPEVFTATERKPLEPATCIITGRKMRYRDPLSGQPCADQDAFSELRKWYKVVWSNVPTKLGGGKVAGSRSSEALSPMEMPVSQRQRFNAVFPKCLHAVLEVKGQDHEVMQKAVQRVVHELVAQQEAEETGDVGDTTASTAAATTTPATAASPKSKPPLAEGAKGQPLPHPPPQHIAPVASPAPFGTAQQMNFPTATMLDHLSLQRQQLMYQQFFMPSASAAGAMPTQQPSDVQQALAMYPALQYYSAPFAFGQWNSTAMYSSPILPMMYQQPFRMPTSQVQPPNNMPSPTT
eukprot:GGOE01001987.1.p1 GENE.GGOE01001987.1~~GGOE01001987.1.p1  ORF type:complete len:540 (-),score=142.16 GGOE01001987.1:274-1821(-)